MQKKTKAEIWRAIKFVLFSISAGVIQIGSTELLFLFLPYWPSYLIGLTLSVLWNFTFNRKFTFQSAKNVPVAMLLVFAFYVVFTPVSTVLGNLAVRHGGNETVVLIVTMLANFVLEFVYNRFVVYRDSIDTAVKATPQDAGDETDGQSKQATEVASADTQVVTHDTCTDAPTDTQN